MEDRRLSIICISLFMVVTIFTVETTASPASSDVAAGTILGEEIIFHADTLAAGSVPAQQVNNGAAKSFDLLDNFSKSKQHNKQLRFAKTSPQDGEELVDVETELQMNGNIKLKFISHGREHLLELTESRMKFADIPVKLVGSSEELNSRVIEDLKNVKMMIDDKHRATIAFRIQDGSQNPLIQTGIFKLGIHQFDLAFDPSSNKTKVTRKPADDKIWNKKLIHTNKVRQKRETPDEVPQLQATVELVFVVDYAIWSKRSAGPVVAEGQTNHTFDVLLYFAHLAEMMNSYYSTMGNKDIEIGIDLAGVVILTSSEQFSNIVEDKAINGRVDSKSTLEGFASWLNTIEASKVIPPYDHIMLFTGYGVYHPTLGNIKDGFFHGKICQSYLSSSLSSSLVEYTGMLTFDARTASTVLGRSMGADADGTLGSVECPQQNYIMSARSDEYPQNGHLFSRCSQRSFYLTIKNSGDCLMTKSAVPNYPSSIDEIVSQDLPGETFTADDQCYMALGTEACDSSVDICSKLSCFSPVNPLQCVSSTAVGAADGTACDELENRICHRGKCVSSLETDENQGCKSKCYPCADSSECVSSEAECKESCPKDDNCIAHLKWLCKEDISAADRAYSGVALIISAVIALQG